MILSNLRIEKRNDYSFLICDLDSKNFSEKTIWFSVPSEYSYMLTPNLYDPFLVALLFPAMDCGEEIIIKGNVSKKIYKNINSYVQKILITYANYLKKIKIEIQGFDSVKNKEKKLVGTGFSAGVDSFSTFYDHYVLEDDSEYKINTLFFFNVGSHGKFSNSNTQKRFNERYNFLKSFPKEIGIPYIPVDSNLHHFHEKYGHQKTHPISLIAPILVFQSVLSKYYVSNTYNYYEEKKYAMETFDFDLAEFSEFYLLPLLSPDGLEIISDGGQYTRTEKESRIINYEPVKRYLNVCVRHDDGYLSVKNCSCCSKCLRTLMAYDSMDKLDELSYLFDLDIYRKQSYKYKCRQVLDYKYSGFAKDNIDFAKKNKKALPPKIFAMVICAPYLISEKIKKILRALLGRSRYELLKGKINK